MIELKTWGRRWLATVGLVLVAMCLAACGSDGEGDGEVVPAAPVITAQPADTQVAAGTAASFSVGAQGAGLAYQWQRSTDGGTTWVAIAGATGATYTLASPVVGDSSSRFRVVVSRGSAVTTSSAATLTVQALVTPPAITVQLQATQVYVGSDASFSITATGTSLTYSWQTRRAGADWVTVVQPSQPTLQLLALTLADDQLGVRVTVANSAASVTSDPVTLSVRPASAAPLFTSHPANLSVVEPAAATFSVVVTGTPAPTLQWQRSFDLNNWNNIAGATGSSYTIAATTGADANYFFRAVASNAAGVVNSAAARLSVSSGPALPGIRQQPADTTVDAGAAVNLVIVATGTPAPTLQWQLSTDGGLSYANINGATAATLGFTAATTDNGRRYRVVVSNSVGSVTSNAAVLTVRTPARAWAAGQQLETGDGLVVVQASAIDDQGRTTVIFGKIDGARIALFATRGVPGTAGAAPIWSTPVVIDAAAPFDYRDELALVASPNGNLLASWNQRAPCTSATYETSGTCNYVHTARYISATASWQAPMLLGDTRLPGFSARINDAGDIAGVYSGWQRVGADTDHHLASLAWAGGAQTSYQRRVFRIDASADSFGPATVALDGNGLFYAFGLGFNAAVITSEVVVYRGDVRSGVGTREVLASYASAVTIKKAWASPQGAVAAFWQDERNSDAAARVAGHVVTLDRAGGAWSVFHTGLPFDTGYAGHATLTDSGEFIAHSLPRCATLRRTGGVWAAEAALPAALCSSLSFTGTPVPVLARNGNFMVLDNRSGTLGRWLSYDAALGLQTVAFTSSSSGAGYVLGLPALPTGTALLSVGGGGAYISINNFDTLPTTTQTAGTTRGIASLWGWLLQ